MNARALSGVYTHWGFGRLIHTRLLAAHTLMWFNGTSVVVAPRGVAHE